MVLVHLKISIFPLISAWKMRTAAVADQIQVFFTSQTKAHFSVLVCNKTQLASCDSLGMYHSVSAVCIYHFFKTVILFMKSNCICLLLHLLLCSLKTLLNTCMYLLEQLPEHLKHVVLILTSLCAKYK